MKKFFYFLGVAVLATGLMLSCSKDDDNSSSSNNGGNGGSGNGGSGNGGSSNTPSLTFTWDGQTQELRSMELKYHSLGEDAIQIYISASGDKTIQNQTDVIEFPSYEIYLAYIGAGYSNAQPLDIDESYLRIFSTEVPDHMEEFTEPSPNGGGLVTLKTPDYNYVSHTKQNLEYDMDNNIFSGTFTITLSSEYDRRYNPNNIRQKTLKVTANKYPATGTF